MQNILSLRAARNVILASNNATHKRLIITPRPLNVALKQSRFFLAFLYSKGYMWYKNLVTFRTFHEIINIGSTATQNAEARSFRFLNI